MAFANYCRKFILNFAEKAYPLKRLRCKNVSFKWTELCEPAFQSLTTAVVRPPLLQDPNFHESNEFILQQTRWENAIRSVLCNNDGRPNFLANFMTRGQARRMQERESERKICQIWWPIIIP